jgi:hypothetical protein
LQLLQPNRRPTASAGGDRSRISLIHIERYAMFNNKLSTESRACTAPRYHAVSKTPPSFRSPPIPQR